MLDWLKTNWPGALVSFGAPTLILVLLLIGVSATEPRYGDCPNSQQAAQHGEATIQMARLVACKAHAFFHDWGEGLIAIGTLMLALFTGTLWDATRNLLNSAKEDGERMERSIAEAASAATAMQSVAKSMAENTKQIIKTVKLNEVVAERQKVLWQMQMRAYLSVLVGNFYEQDAAVGAFMQAQPVVLNTGNTPAKNVRFKGVVDIRPFPPGPTFDFRLPDTDSEASATTIGPRQDNFMPFAATRRFSDEEIIEAHRAIHSRVYIYGTINYDDTFTESHITNFCFTVVWNAAGKPVAMWTARHNDSD